MFSQITCMLVEEERKGVKINQTLKCMISLLLFNFLSYDQNTTACKRLLLHFSSPHKHYLGYQNASIANRLTKPNLNPPIKA